jgi:hypothetical protein
MKFEKLILAIIILVVFGWLLVLDFVPGSNFVVFYDFCKKQAKVTELSPGDRLFPIEKFDNWCQQKVAASPVYFDVRVPQYFIKATVEVKYKNLAGQKFQFGPQTIKNEWQWLLVDVKETGKEGEWTVGRAEFDLRGVYQNSPRMRWLVSLPEIEKTGQVVVIKEIKITFEKDKLDFNNLSEQVKGYLRKIIR